MTRKNKTKQEKDLFSTNKFVPKLVIAVLIPVIFFTVAALLPTGDEFVIFYTLGLTLVCTVLYLIPFASNIFYLKQRPEKSLKGFILSDLLFVMLPACFSTVLVACVFYLFGKGGDSNNLFAIVLCVIFVITPPLAWCFYWVSKKLSKFNERLRKTEQLLRDVQTEDQE